MATCNFELKHEDILKLKLTGVLESGKIIVLDSDTDVIVFDSKGYFVKFEVMTNKSGFKYLKFNTSKNNLIIKYARTPSYDWEKERIINSSQELFGNPFKEMTLYAGHEFRVDDEQRKLCNPINFKGQLFERRVCDGDVCVSVVTDFSKEKVVLYFNVFNDALTAVEVSNFRVLDIFRR